MKDITWKLSILGDAAKYDASCASSGSAGRGGTVQAGACSSAGRTMGRGSPAAAGNLLAPRSSEPGRFGSAAPAGICHAWGTDGRCISLLKVLFTNACVYDCAYCKNRRSNDIPRASFTVSELVDLTIGFYRRNYIEGLFLSSGIIGDPEYTMRKLLSVVQVLRIDRGFDGYIHVKAIPGASARTIRETGFFADRMSVNIELPSERSLSFLAPEKSREAVFGPMALIDNTEREQGFVHAAGRGPFIAGSGSGPPSARHPADGYPALAETLPDICRDLPVPYGSPAASRAFPSAGLGERPAGRPGLHARQSPPSAGQPFVPAGQSTQMIIGASPEPDSQIVRLAEGLYRKFGLKRVYYSAYIPVNEDPRLPPVSAPPLLREHRLYQADWLLRFYRFSAAEIVPGDAGALDPDLDPKAAWALANFSLFPVDVKKADYDTLLRVPGIGVISARRVMAARRTGILTFDSLRQAGVVLKRARYFITCGGKSLEPPRVDPDWIRAALLDTPRLPGPDGKPGAVQPELPW